MGKGNRTRNEKYQSAYDMSGSGAAKAVKSAPKKDRTASIVLAAIIALLALSLVLVVFSDSGIKDRNTTIVSSENYEVTGTMITYFENLAFNNMFNQYFNLYYTYVYPNDINSAYNQAYSAVSGQNFFDSALTSVKEILILCEAAKAEGITLDAEDEASIEETLDGYEGNFAGFGTGVKEKDIRKALTLETLAGKYYDKYHEDQTASLTEADVNKYIEENKTDFYASHYLKYAITLTAEDFADITEDFTAAKELATKYVSLIANAKTESEFKNQIIRYLVDRDFDGLVANHVSTDNKPDEAGLATEKADLIADLVSALIDGKTVTVSDSASDLEKEMHTVFEKLESTCTTALDGLAGEQAYAVDPTDDEVKWLIDTATSAFSTKIVDASSDEEYSRTVYMLTEPLHLEDDVTVNVGHILVEVASTATDEEKAAAKAEAQAILDTYLAGEKTKDAFEKLAEEKTADSGVFYENVAKGDMVEAFENWIFSEERSEVGETGIVETEFGYHVMYWDGEGENTSVVAAKQGIVDDRYQKFVEEAASSLKINEKAVAKRTAETEAETEAA